MVKFSWIDIEFYMYSIKNFLSDKHTLSKTSRNIELAQELKLGIGLSEFRKKKRNMNQTVCFLCGTTEYLSSMVVIGCLSAHLCAQVRRGEV